MRRAVVLLAVVAALLGMVTLGGGDKGSAQAAVTKAAARTLDTGSSRFTLTWTAPELPIESASEMSVRGVMDYTHHRGRISSPGSESLFDGNVVYVNWSMPWRSDTRWLRLEADSDELDPFDLQERAMHNPISLLDFLTGASDNVREVGSEDVRSTATTHYEGTLDLQKVVDQAPQDKRAELQEWLNFMGEVEPTKVPFGLWIDGDGVAHRLRIDQEGDGSVTIEYYDFGVAVEVTPPPADEIMSSEEFQQELEAHAQDSSCDGDGSSVGGSTSTVGGEEETSASEGATVHFCIQLFRSSAVSAGATRVP